MKGTPERQAAIYHTFNVEDLIEAGHPLRPIKRMVNRALADMSRTFKAAYSDTGRPGIPPETLLKALLLQCLYTNDCRRQPIKYGAYSISHRGGHPHVRIDLEAYMGFKAQMLEVSLRRDRDALERMMSIPLFVPYAPVRRQLWNVCREMNRVRSAAGLSSLRTECLNFRRRIVRPFGEPVGMSVGVDASMGGSELEVSSMQDIEEWNRLNGPGREEPPRNPNADLPRDWRAKLRDVKPVDLGIPKPEPKAQFPEAWAGGPSEDDRDPNRQGGGLGNVWPEKRPNGPGRGREPGR